MGLVCAERGAASGADQRLAPSTTPVRKGWGIGLRECFDKTGKELPAADFSRELAASYARNCEGRLEARVGIEPTHKGFADLSLTTWVPRPCSHYVSFPDEKSPSRAVLGRDSNSGIRIWSGRRGSNPRHRPWQGRALPLSYSRSCLHFTVLARGLTIRDRMLPSSGIAEYCQD
jgi:hypothetical protein